MKKLILAFLISIAFSWANSANAQYSVTSGDQSAAIYQLNNSRTTLPIFAQIPISSNVVNISLSRDGQKSFDTKITNTVDGWMIGDHFFAVPGSVGGLAFDFTTGSVYVLPADLTGTIIKSMTAKDKRELGKSGTGDDSDLRLALVDASVLRKEQKDKFFMIIDPRKGANGHLEYIPAKPAVIDNTSYVHNGIIVKDRPVITAAANGQSDLVNKLVASGGDINEVESATGDNALIMALRAGDEHMPDQLLKLGINPKHVNRYGQNALHISSEKGFYDVSQKLLVAGADVNQKDNGGNSPLMYASTSPNPYLVDLLVRRGAKINDVNNNKSSALSFAAYNGNTRSAEMLLAAGADPISADASGNTILMQAVKGGNENIVRQLLSAKGVDINAPDQNGNTPLHAALQMNNTKMAEILIDAGADINAVNSAGRTPLMVASGNGNEAITKKILAKNPDLRIVDNEGHTAYDLSKDPSTQRIVSQAISDTKNRASALFDLVAANDISGVEEQLAKGAQINMSDPETGNTPIFTATANNYRDILSLLIKHGADVNWQNKRGNTPLMTAMATGDEKTIDIMFKAGAKVNMQNNNGDTALIWATKLNNLDFVRILLTAGADANVRNYSGATPLSIAIGENMIDVERMLRSFGAF